MNNWRVPIIDELVTLIDHGQHSPALPGDHLFGDKNLRTDQWSSTTAAYDPDHAWNVYFYYGYVSSHDKYYDLYVRCVRGSLNWSFDYSPPRFRVVEEGEILDKKTGLIWQREASGSMGWAEAIEYAESLRQRGEIDNG